MVTTAQREAFDRDGYVVVPDLLSADELDRLGAAVDDAVAARTARDRRTLAEKSRYEQSFQQCINLWEDHPGVRPLTFHQGIAGVAAVLLEVAALRLSAFNKNLVCAACNLFVGRVIGISHLFGHRLQLMLKFLVQCFSPHAKIF